MEGNTDIRFAKVGKKLINLRSVERFIFLDSEVYLSTTAGNEFTVENARDETREQLMKNIARRMDEKTHDIIYLEAFAKKSEDMLEEDAASNLLFRQWLERRRLTPERSKIKAIRFGRKKER